MKTESTKYSSLEYVWKVVEFANGLSLFPAVSFQYWDTTVSDAKYPILVVPVSDNASASNSGDSTGVSIILDQFPNGPLFFTY